MTKFASFTIVLLFVTVCTQATLYDTLSQGIFLNQGTTYASDDYAFLPIPCMYLEPENVSCAHCSWEVGPSCPYLFQINGSISQTCTPQAPTPGYDRPGGDLDAHPVVGGWQGCQQRCCDTLSCNSWTFAIAPGASIDCAGGDQCCYLKSGVPDAKASTIPQITSGIVNKPAIPAVPPPVGVRSAVPLGGIGAGSIELRADGSFHEWTIINQSPGGAAKFGIVDEALLGVRIQQGSNTVTKSLRTHPPVSIASSGVASMSYSGSYPLSKLTPHDGELPLQVNLFAYSKLRPGDMDASGAPAIVFTLAVQNDQDTEADVDFLLTLPFGGFNSCSRPSSHVLQSVPATDPADCVTACAALAGCASWTLSKGSCALASDIPWSIYDATAYCGVRGVWTADGERLNLDMHPPGSLGSPAAGDITLQPVVSDVTSASFLTANTIAEMWSQFASGQHQADIRQVTARHGGAVVHARVGARQSVTLSIVFAWYFPDRDHMYMDLGNYYSTRFDSSLDVADPLAEELALIDIVSDLNSHHAVFANSSMPVWLSDSFINSMSHFRSAMWFRDGRWRQWEAYDCPDVDSVHNDYQRHLPYLWLFPRTEMQKMREWGAGQPEDGHIWEYLASFGLGPMDQWGGRIMGDVTSVWLIELWEIYSQTGDSAFLQELYPTAVRAIGWQMAQAKEIGLPMHLVCTYDIINFDQYNTTTFNGMLHLASMQAAVALATTMNDSATAAAAKASYDAGVSAVFTLLWNSTDEYFRAYTGGEALMADCLYGAMLAQHNGFGWVVDPSYFSKHLTAELKYNGNDYGLSVVTGRHTPPPVEQVRSKTPRQQMLERLLSRFGQVVGQDGQDDVDWEGAGPDWSYMQLMLGQMSVEEALEPARKSVENFRSRLNDAWNIVGITTSGNWGDENANGQPYVTSHYGFLLTHYYLAYALSGQQSSIAHGELKFSPVYHAPYRVPLLLPGTTGTVSRETDGTIRVELAFGSLRLPAGGLIVDDNAYPYQVNLLGGEAVTWKAK
eukprot:TRINITY_DN8763_c0_g1_i1.p1 TRINITY_DN8763_c0_g1~~TRINITY_DN8763_c0_g1_i1.p1  ORF type:complete len:1014 (+),score=226.22 TRINITY_DN8763_c0_g1_i1:103-3144(+)